MIAFAMTLALLSADAPAQVEPLKFDPAALAKIEKKVEIKVQERDGEASYRGVPLRTLLEDQWKGPKPAMSDLRALSDAVLIIRGTDGYQAAVSAASVAMDDSGERYVLALERNGKPLDKDQGPVKLLIPGDPMRVRWVRNIEAVELVRMPKPAAVKAKP